MNFSPLERQKNIKKNGVTSCNMDNLKQNIIWYRKKMKWSQEQLGAIYNLSRDNIASYERGIALPGINMLSQICKDLGVYLHEFINEDLSKLEPRPDVSIVIEDQKKILSSKDKLIKQLQEELEEKKMIVDLQTYKIRMLEMKVGEEKKN